MRKVIVLTVAVAALAACMENDVVAPELDELPENAVIYFPGRGDSWDQRLPEDAGFDRRLLEEAIDYAMANEADTPTDLRAYLESRSAGLPDQEILGPIKDRGAMAGMIVRDGYLVAEWGDTNRVDMAFSITKSFLSTLVGLAHERGLIASLDDAVAGYVDDGGYASDHNAAITWHHSLRQTSEWEGTLWDKPDSADRREGRDRTLNPPGTFWEYNDVRVNRTAYSLLQVWGESLAEVLDREIMTPIGASRAWRWHGYRNSTVTVKEQEIESVSGGGHWGGGLWISTRDLARFGLLHLHGGRWRNQQILSPEWIESMTRPEELNPTYGYMWWLNTDAALWPSAPSESFAARGGGTNLLWIDPTRDLIVVVRWLQPGTEDGLLARVVEALRRP